MSTLTLRNLPDPVKKRLENLAQENKKSINKTAIELLEKALGISPFKQDAHPRTDVSSVVRKWTQEEIQEFERNTACFESIDEEMWR